MKPSAYLLKLIFLRSFKDENEFENEGGNPFLIKFNKSKYYVFLKNISPAYYPKYPDITRIQLPYSKHFNNIAESNIPFIILGFNSEFETFTAWDPTKIKDRLNNKSNVSLFSRDSFQEKLIINDFKEHQISNGDKVILFSINSTPIYFRSVKSLFGRTKAKLNLVSKNQLTFNLFDSKVKLEKIDNKSLFRKLKLLIRNEKILEAVNICAIHYQDDYPKMELKDWFDLVENLGKKNL